MPLDPGLPSREAYVKNLIPVAICSAASRCPICQEEYKDGHSPVLLRHCGHIFGKPCILEWFEEGANKCPLDRNELFTPLTDAEEYESWSLVPFSLGRTQGAVGINFGRGGELRSRTRATSAHYLFFSGEIIGVNGHLTHEGCLCIVRDLWYHTQVFFRQSRQIMDEMNVLAVGVDVLSGLIDDALPRGINVPEQAWPLLISGTRLMLAWQNQAWEEGWEAYIPREQMQCYVEELCGICGMEDEG
ncbi:hypothetical protein BDW02DRAFT_605181 [Decorospora gaudefroyi]|uniref:RING-type domain-containing protein n=1 Tax=Decorospora gaudefroyi TaxID=184978 RepID=A0A6A5K5W9_9PLEO|nr:hypothetical protein BDW02DRAFT_605181 [Decorospora gaudefroyi]